MEKETSEVIFRMEDWKGDFLEDCPKGALVEDAVVEMMINSLPPRKMGYLTQVGSACNHLYDKKKNAYRPTYATFICLSKKLWRYVGQCFVGEYSEPELVSE